MSQLVVDENARRRPEPPRGSAKEGDQTIDCEVILYDEIMDLVASGDRTAIWFKITELVKKYEHLESLTAQKRNLLTDIGNGDNSIATYMAYLQLDEELKLLTCVYSDIEVQGDVVNKGYSGERFQIFVSQDVDNGATRHPTTIDFWKYLAWWLYTKWDKIPATYYGLLTTNPIDNFQDLAIQVSSHMTSDLLTPEKPAAVAKSNLDGKKPPAIEIPKNTKLPKGWVNKALNESEKNTPEKFSKHNFFYCHLCKKEGKKDLKPMSRQALTRHIKEFHSYHGKKTDSKKSPTNENESGLKKMDTEETVILGKRLLSPRGVSPSLSPSMERDESKESLWELSTNQNLAKLPQHNNISRLRSYSHESNTPERGPKKKKKKKRKERKRPRLRKRRSSSLEPEKLSPTGTGTGFDYEPPEGIKRSISMSYDKFEPNKWKTDDDNMNIFQPLRDWEATQEQGPNNDEDEDEDEDDESIGKKKFNRKKRGGKSKSRRRRKKRTNKKSRRKKRN